MCTVNENDNLVKIVETHNIFKKEDAAVAIADNGTETPLTGNERVSMNFWGFHPSVFKTLETKFVQFLETEIDKPKSEMYIPSVVFEMIEDNEVEVKVLEANSPWFGVTYKEDKPIVVNKIKALIKEGVYPEKLW
jgi:hypothetical protein